MGTLCSRAAKSASHRSVGASAHRASSRASRSGWDEPNSSTTWARCAAAACGSARCAASPLAASPKSCSVTANAARSLPQSLGTQYAYSALHGACGRDIDERGLADSGRPLNEQPTVLAMARTIEDPDEKSRLGFALQKLRGRWVRGRGDPLSRRLTVGRPLRGDWRELSQAPEIVSRRRPGA